MTYGLASTDNGATRRTQLPEEVASYARELIISGQVRPGDYLRLEPIGAALGVSNTPVREGLFTLQSEGFVRLVPRRGFVVAPFTQRDLRDLFWTQGQLAGELAARACKNMTSEQFAQLEANLAQYEKATSQEQIAQLGHSFHRTINLAADSRQLALLLGSVVRRLPNRFYTAIDGHVDSTRESHPLIVNALRQRQARKVRTLMSDHLTEGGEHLIAMLEDRGVWAGR